MSISVNDSLGASSQANFFSSSPPAAAPVAPENSDSADSVKLSESGQIHLLKQEGQTPSQISRSLGIPVATVNGYLDILTPAVASSNQSPAPQVKAQADATGK